VTVHNAEIDKGSAENDLSQKSKAVILWKMAFNNYSDKNVHL